MKCEWIEDTINGGYKCKHCGFHIHDNSFNKRCSTTSSPIQPKRPPSMLRRAINFGKAAAKHVVSGMPTCTEEEKAKRFSICKSNKCGLFRKNPGDDESGVCAHDDCGCPIRSKGQFIDKLSWAGSECPEGLWGAITPNSSENPENGV